MRLLTSSTSGSPILVQQCHWKKLKKLHKQLKIHIETYNQYPEFLHKITSHRYFINDVTEFFIFVSKIRRYQSKNPSSFTSSQNQLLQKCESIKQDIQRLGKDQNKEGEAVLTIILEKTDAYLKFEEFMEWLDEVEKKWSLVDKWGLNESFRRLGEKWVLRIELKDRICEMRDDLMNMIAFGDECEIGVKCVVFKKEIDIMERKLNSVVKKGI
ncbi:5898_t:CDS:1 [Dentiscutata heterogama]|uniref:5898_t:CDS:1 n=1 Tax=Dentiscutata heterogama TaxID=1316150 RepID=A0ACA9KGY5_9GLOM|nr:5898_t:CDS:1 [Dentiscutata heterogama]